MARGKKSAGKLNPAIGRSIPSGNRKIGKLPHSGASMPKGGGNPGAPVSRRVNGSLKTGLPTGKKRGW